MLSRAFILETLARLPVWAWPVFLWDVFWLERYYRAFRAANPVGMLGIGVTPDGRNLITLQAKGRTPEPAGWTRLAPPAPWLRLDPAAIAAVIEGACKLSRNHTENRLFSDCGWTLPGPAFLDSG